MNKTIIYEAYNSRNGKIQLREMEPSDIESLSSILQDSNTMYAYNGAFNGEETMIWIQKQLQRYKDFGFGSWGVRILTE